MAQPDPVSVTMTRAARRLLDRVYAADGDWAATRLADPTAAQLGYWLLHGINVRGPDPVRSGTARTRWGRAYVRRLWYEHQWWSAAPGTAQWRTARRTVPRRVKLDIEVGPWLPARGELIPPGREVRVRLAAPSHATWRDVPPERRYSHGGGAQRSAGDQDW
jgi:hypothetical protein